MNNHNSLKKKKGESKTQVKVELVGILSALLAFVLSWILATIVCQFQIGRIILVFINIISTALLILGAGGITEVYRLRGKAKQIALPVAGGCVVGCIVAYCTYNFWRIEIKSQEPFTPPSSGQAIDVVVSSDRLSPIIDDDSSTSLAPTEMKSDNKSENNGDDTITISKPVPPVVVTVAPNSDTLMGKSVLKDFFDLIGYEDELLTPSAENKSFWKGSLEAMAWDLTNTNTHPDSFSVNNDQNHTQKTEEANKLVEQMEENGYTVEAALAVIALREAAYELHETAALRSLLSSDYTKLADYYKKAGKWEEAYDYYMTAIEYKTLCLRLISHPNDTYYLGLYDLADLYHKIGDMKGLNTNGKHEAYYLSACFYELASANLSEKQRTKQADSFYYAAMVNQKLFQLKKEAPSSEWVAYFIDACSYYEQSLKYNRNMSDKYAALNTLYEWGKSQTNNKNMDGLLTSDEYAELQKKIKEQRQ